jgi:hypothetical protein
MDGYFEDIYNLSEDTTLAKATRYQHSTKQRNETYPDEGRLEPLQYGTPCCKEIVGYPPTIPDVH